MLSVDRMKGMTMVLAAVSCMAGRCSPTAKVFQAIEHHCVDEVPELVTPALQGFIYKNAEGVEVECNVREHMWDFEFGPGGPVRDIPTTDGDRLMLVMDGALWAECQFYPDCFHSNRWMVDCGYGGVEASDYMHEVRDRVYAELRSLDRCSCCP